MWIDIYVLVPVESLLCSSGENTHMQYIYIYAIYNRQKKAPQQILLSGFYISYAVRVYFNYWVVSTATANPKLYLLQINSIYKQHIVNVILLSNFYVKSAPLFTNMNHFDHFKWF